MRYDLRAPCGKPTPCPFRTDAHPYLRAGRAGRAAEIAEALYNGSTFACHKTTVCVDTDDEGESVRETVSGSQMCGGAMAVMLRENPRGFQLLLLARHVDKLSQATWDALRRPELPVYDSLTAWVSAYTEADETAAADKVVDPVTGEVLDMEHCGVVGWRCADPAGYAVGGGAIGNTDPPTCNPLTDECAGCSRLMCEACRGADGRCVNCLDEDEDDPGDDHAAVDHFTLNG